LHVTLRAKKVVPSLRAELVMNLVRVILLNQRRKKYAADFRILQFSIQKDHLHLIVEAEGDALRSGISGFEIAFARRLNALLGRSGKVWDSRYHRRDLETPRAVRIGLRYVLLNAKKHGAIDPHMVAVDVYSSAFLFDGWSIRINWLWTQPWARLRPRTWLLRTGWRAHGLLDPIESPRLKAAA
jgi:REP element-mobilizing transposase RayT